MLFVNENPVKLQFILSWINASVNALLNLSETQIFLNLVLFVNKLGISNFLVFFSQVNFVDGLRVSERGITNNVRNLIGFCQRQFLLQLQGVPIVKKNEVCRQTCK